MARKTKALHLKEEIEKRLTHLQGALQGSESVGQSPRLFMKGEINGLTLALSLIKKHFDLKDEEDDKE